MKIEKYLLKAEADLTVFEFVSEGLDGTIQKVIQFQRTEQPHLYNLAFGDKNLETGEVDDLAVSNNGDSEKVLATVAAAMFAFLDKYPDAFVYATGSTSARTRLYRIGISRFYNEIIQRVDLYGQLGEEFHEFQIGTEYIGFLAQKK